MTQLEKVKNNFKTVNFKIRNREEKIEFFSITYYCRNSEELRSNILDTIDAILIHNTLIEYKVITTTNEAIEHFFEINEDFDTLQNILSDILLSQ